MDHKPIFSTVSTTPNAPSTPSSTSDAFYPTSLSSSALNFTRLPLPQLDQAKYPNVQHWCEDNYKGLRKLGKAGNKDNLKGKNSKGSILSRYMEDENGEAIPEATRDAARDAARGFFSLLLEKDRAPPTWRDASIDIKNELVHILESNFYFIRLCDNHWKASKIATNSYSQWYPKALQRRAKALAKKVANSKVIDVDADDDKDKSPKRPRTKDDDMRGSKRPRVEDTQTPPPLPPRPARVTTERQRVCNLFILTICATDSICEKLLYEFLPVCAAEVVYSLVLRSTDIQLTPAVAMIPLTQVSTRGVVWMPSLFPFTPGRFGGSQRQDASTCCRSIFHTCSCSCFPLSCGRFPRYKLLF